MAFTSLQLITDAYRYSGIYARNFQYIPGDAIDDGLDRLNEFLSIKGAQTKLIPYFTQTNGNLVVGQEKYFFENLVSIDSLTFFLEDQYNQTGTNTVRMQMRPLSRYEYFSIPRAEKVETLPYSWRLERTVGGSNVFIYFLPDQPYPYELWGKYALQRTTLNQDLSLVYDEWYLTYLTYGLVIFLCNWRNVMVPAFIQEQFNAIEKYMTTLSPMDMSFRKLSFFKSSAGLNWGDVNYGKGWRNGAAA